MRQAAKFACNCNGNTKPIEPLLIGIVIEYNHWWNYASADRDARPVGKVAIAKSVLNQQIGPLTSRASVIRKRGPCDGKTCVQSRPYQTVAIR
jgi:hypothetical protein